MKLNRSLIILLKMYTIAVLVSAAIVSTPVTAFFPVLLVVIYLVLWRWPFRYQYRLLADYFIFLAISILMAPILGAYLPTIADSPLISVLSVIIALPSLVPLTRSLEEVAEGLSPNKKTKQTRYPTSINLGLFTIVIMTLVLAFWIGNLALIISSVIAIVFFGVYTGIIFRSLSIKPVEEEQCSKRLLAGEQTKLKIRLTPRTRLIGTLFLISSYEWVQVPQGAISLKEDEFEVEVSITPPLSGTSVIHIEGYVIDRWGLMQTKIVLEPTKLTVIPRAKYAMWLIQRYLTGTRAGILPLASEFEALKPMFGLRRGVEYFGSREYQAGDSLRSIDWKHSVKFNELISKEFAEFHGQPAAILINLVAGNAEEADILAYNILVTALSLAQENIPAAIGAYDMDTIKVVTGLLTPPRLVRQALEMVGKIITVTIALRYIKPPDITRLKANISRLGSTENKAALTLRQILQIEYKNLNNITKKSPTSRAFAATLNKIRQQAAIIVISHRNHDAEALAVQTYLMAAQGNTVIKI